MPKAARQRCQLLDDVVRGSAHLQANRLVPIAAGDLECQGVGGVHSVTLAAQLQAVRGVGEQVEMEIQV